MAVFECKKKYYQLSAGQVNNHKNLIGYDYNHLIGEYVNPHVVGSYIETEDGKMDMRVYTFSGGERHNQLKLTNETEIQNMRAYIARRHDDFFKEIMEVKND